MRARCRVSATTLSTERSSVDRRGRAEQLGCHTVQSADQQNGDSPRSSCKLLVRDQFAAGARQPNKGAVQNSSRKIVAESTTSCLRRYEAFGNFRPPIFVSVLVNELPITRLRRESWNGRARHACCAISTISVTCEPITASRTGKLRTTRQIVFRRWDFLRQPGCLDD
jgi:hypothetical protein